jgi:hypothetical protein
MLINNQVVKSKMRTISAASQVASGSGKDSTGGTNSVIASSNNKQQFALGGGPGARGVNKGMNGK